MAAIVLPFAMEALQRLRFSDAGPLLLFACWHASLPRVAQLGIPKLDRRRAERPAAAGRVSADQAAVFQMPPSRACAAGGPARHSRLHAHRRYPAFACRPLSIP